jgi:hypothetical protein
MHADGLLSWKYFCFVYHHTRFVQRWLPIQNQGIPIFQVSIHLLVYGGCPSMEAFPSCYHPFALLRGEELICNGCPLFNSEFVLANNVNAIPY